MKKLTLLLMFCLSCCFSALAAIEVYQFDSPEQEQLFNDLGKELRCPKCQNNNIADSNAGLAKDLRDKVYVMLKEGKTEDEIVDYMVARYGNFVTYNPPLTGSTAILWLGPLLLIGIGVVVLLQLSQRKNSAKPSLTATEQQRLTALLQDDKDDHEASK